MIKFPCNSRTDWVTIDTMKTLVEKLGKLYNKIRGLFPSPIPVGMTEFNDWVNSIMATYTLPTSDRDTIVFSLGAMIMHLDHGPKTLSAFVAAYKPKFYFVLALRSGAAKQIAHAAFVEIKQKQQQAEAQARANLAGATALTAVPNGHQG